MLHRTTPVANNIGNSFVISNLPTSQPSEARHAHTSGSRIPPAHDIFGGRGHAHAFLDHASPLVGGTVAVAPREVRYGSRRQPRQLPALPTIQRSKDFWC